MNSLHTQLSECRSVLARERDALIAARANVDSLRAENARLRAALKSAASLIHAADPQGAVCDEDSLCVACTALGGAR